MFLIIHVVAETLKLHYIAAVIIGCLRISFGDEFSLQLFISTECGELSGIKKTLSPSRSRLPDEEAS